MSEGFKSFLDECALRFGALDDPEAGRVRVETDDGKPELFSAVGVDNVNGITVLYGFSWKYIDADTGDLKDEPILALEGVIPWHRVKRFDMPRYDNGR